LKIRERELQLLQEERRKREELEKKLSNEINLREKIIEENIKLRDKKQTQVISCNLDLIELIIYTSGSSTNPIFTNT
jgi:long-subunit acyl-CoA synthetase (AMP-forming)